MIEPTDEMRAAFRAVYAPDNDADCDSCLNRRLAAVLAIVERDRRAECGTDGPDGRWCVRMPHPATELHGWIGDGELVQW